MLTSERKSGRNRLLSLAICVAMLGVAGFSGCHKQAIAGQTANDSGPDPADANMAPVDDGQAQAATQPPGQSNIENESQQQAAQYRQNGTQAGAPPADQSAQQPDQQDQSYADNPNDPNDQNYDDQVDAGQDAIEEADQPPPALPTYEQPDAPGPNYLWTPGYWNYASLGYYWVPGAWVAAPYYGALWTPGYWGFYSGRYRFYRGYWGPHIGFYGGINYGFGYTGTGYYGGYWNGNNFYYNRAVNRINTGRTPYVYNRTVIGNHNSRIAFNGGRGGIQVRPNRSEMVAMRGPKTRPMSAQIQNQRQAAQNRQQFFNQNRGRPATVVSRPLTADKGLQRPVARPQVRPNQPNQGRPGQPNNQVRPGQGQIRPGQPNQTRPNQPNRPEVRPNQPQVRPNQPQARPNQPQNRPFTQQTRPAQPQQQARPEYRPNQPQTRPVQPQVRPTQPQRPVQQPRQEARPAQQQRPQRQMRPAAQSRPQPRAEAPRGQAPHNNDHDHH